MAIGDRKVLTVTQLNMYVRSLLESSVYLNDITLVGEISNFTNHYKSGHFYLSLKDDTGLIRAVMFRQYASHIGFKPENGMKVICKGRVSLYERDGQYQFYITSMEEQGLGELTVRFERLKQKLKNEGLFDEDKKCPIPKMPKTIAVITSPTGAALQDILNILTRRFPVVKVILCPVQVQGDLAAPQMIKALEKVNRLKCADTVIIGRGGGSIEDLWAFNDEQLARAVRASEIPVISAVGHETDFTICDFAADLRAPTPSASAELSVPDKNELLTVLNSTRATLLRILKNTHEQKRLKLSALMNKQCMTSPMTMIEQRGLLLDSTVSRFDTAYKTVISEKKHGFVSISSKLSSLSPLNVLLRGYSAVFMEDKPVSSANELKSGDNITIRFADGEKNAVVS